MIKKLQRKLALVLTLLTALLLAGALSLGLINILQQQKANNQLEFFLKVSNLYGYLLNTYMNGEEIDSTQLTAFERENNILLRIEKNGERVDFEPGFGKETDREGLFAAAEELHNAGEGTQNTVGSSIFYDAVTVMNPEEESGTSEVAAPSAGSTSAGGSTPGEPSLYIGGGAGSLMVSVDTSQGGNRYLQDVSGQKYRWIALPLYLKDDVFVKALVLQNVQEETRQQQVTVILFLLFFLIGTALLWLISSLFAKILLKSTAEGIQRQSEFVAAASHELRSPLAVIRASLSAAQQAQTEQENQKYTKAAVAEAERMSRLVGDLLLLAGGDAGSWKMQSQPLDLDTVLIETAEQFAPIAKKSGLSLALELPEETLPPIAGDGDRMRQILAVLLNNAVQYAPSNTEIVLQARQKKNKIEIEVVDHGQGLSDEEKAKVFERFYRADKSRTDKERFGLGLPVAKELTELHSGALTVHDTPGGGATFRVTLPVQQA